MAAKKVIQIKEQEKEHIVTIIKKASPDELEKVFIPKILSKNKGVKGLNSHDKKYCEWILSRKVRLNKDALNTMRTKEVLVKYAGQFVQMTK